MINRWFVRNAQNYHRGVVFCGGGVFLCRCVILCHLRYILRFYFGAHSKETGACASLEWDLPTPTTRTQQLWCDAGEYVQRALLTKIMDAETSPRTCLGLNHDLVFLFRLFYSSATMIRVFPYAGTQFMMFDSLKRWALQRKTRRDPHAEQRLSNMESLMSG